MIPSLVAGLVHVTPCFIMQCNAMHGHASETIEMSTTFCLDLRDDSRFLSIKTASKPPAH